MPWKECSVMDERLQFVARRLVGEPMSDLCPGRVRTDDLPGQPGRAYPCRLEASISSWIERWDFQLFSCRSRRRASAKVSNCS